jgi:3-deoxy-manno-octulosonate cytidylyltransferase (CMP-KDO synthetase)
MADTLVVIPCRMQATRLPGKPLADIHGQPMVVHVMRIAESADIGPVLIATDSTDILAAVEKAGGKAVMTRNDHASGSDRVFEAVSQATGAAANCDVVLNLQGDLPTLQPSLLTACLAPLSNSATDIATLAAKISEPAEKDNPNVVKVVGTPLADPNLLRALYFTRATAPSGDGPLYHHIGIYAFRRDALQRFVDLPPSTLEQRERLEQLRALEAGMRIDVSIVDTVPLGVDTPADLERARAFLKP